MLSSKTHKLILVVSVAGLALALIAAGLLLTRKETTPSFVERIAPDFSLKLLDGGVFKMAENKGKPIVINFFASWCLPCREEASTLAKVRGEYQPKGVVFLAIAVNDNEKDVKKFIKKYHFTLPVGLDKIGNVKDAYKLYGLPTTFFIGKKGKISYFHPGSATEELLHHEIDKLL